MAATIQTWPDLSFGLCSYYTTAASSKQGVPVRRRRFAQPYLPSVAPPSITGISCRAPRAPRQCTASGYPPAAIAPLYVWSTDSPPLGCQVSSGGGGTREKVSSRNRNIRSCTSLDRGNHENVSAGSRHSCRSIMESSYSMAVAWTPALLHAPYSGVCHPMCWSLG
jgi:hypothetical protein